MGIYDLIKLLSDGDVDYVLVGGLAVALHGYVRTTMDVDVVLAMNPDNLNRFISSANKAGLHPAIPVPIESLTRPELLDQWHREKNLLAFSLRSADAQSTVIDILIRPSVAFDALRRDAVTINVGPHAIPVASIEHLIALKTGTGRHKDEIDIEELEKIKRSTS